MAITEEEAQLIREDRRAGMRYQDLATKYKKSFRDIKLALTEEEGKGGQQILPTVTVQVGPNQLRVEVKWP